MIETIGYGASFLSRKLKPKRFERQDPGPADLELELLFCGVCHSDIHQVKNDWHNTVFPCVPGHEIVGRVTRVGQGVKKFRVGDLAAVGCMIDSCGSCYSCQNGDEQYCESSTGFLGTYNGPMNPTLQNTYGGYSSHLVLKEDFALAVPDGLALEAVGPILCAGVTTFSALKHWKVEKGMRVGIVGFGGLGHMATQIARAMGAEVTVVSTSEDKKSDALQLGAGRFVLSSEKKQMKDAASSLDLILNTVPEKHKIEPYIELLHRDGAMTVVGVLAKQPAWNPQKIVMQRKTVGGSLIGSIAETREILEFCALHKIAPRIEMIKASEINEAHQKVREKKARYRFVIDLESLKQEERASLPKIKSVSHVLQKDKKVILPQPPVHVGDDRRELSPQWAHG